MHELREGCVLTSDSLSSLRDNTPVLDACSSRWDTALLLEFPITQLSVEQNRK